MEVFQKFKKKNPNNPLHNGMWALQKMSSPNNFFILLFHKLRTLDHGFISELSVETSSWLY